LIKFIKILKLINPLDKEPIMLIDQTQTEKVTLTPAAAQAVQDLMVKRELTGYALRVFVSGGGCSGYQYGMALENNIRPTDLSFETDGVQLVIDEISIQYMAGATIDYVDEVMGSGFKIENPMAVSSCGCGSSFRTKDESYSSSGGGCGCH
jgi:iron-sulfur cluster assembly protein